jgi:hypothetical protein
VSTTSATSHMVANLPSSAFRHSSRSLADKRPPPNRRPPSHRHAVPSGPWPWIDIEHPCPVYCRTSGADDWWDYPRNKYPNWSGDQIERSQIKQAIEQPWETPCTIYIMGLQASGKFQTAEPIAFTKQNQADLWAHLQTKVPPNDYQRSHVDRPDAGSAKLGSAFGFSLSNPFLDPLYK